MPELYLRGSLANVTMANLTTDEKFHVESVVEYVATHPGMARHRAGVIEELGNTIGADYQSDKRCGDAEFQIAIWKATVELYYHRKYTFRCGACGSNTWITQQGVEREFNRQKLDCPNCKQVEVLFIGDTDLLPGIGDKAIAIIKEANSEAKATDLLKALSTPFKFTHSCCGKPAGECDGCEEQMILLCVSEPTKEIQRLLNCDETTARKATNHLKQSRSYVSFDEFQESYKYFTPVQNAPKCESPIGYLAGEKKYRNPDNIINDDTQLVKFFGEFVWNYFRQQLAENIRREHKKEPRKIVGRADEVITQELLALCQKMKIDHNYCQRDQPQYGRHTIAVVGLLTPPEFTAEFAVLCDKAKNHGVVVNCNASEIYVIENSNAESIEALISKPEHVMVLDNSTKSGGEDGDGGFTISQISFRTVGAQKMNQDDIATIDANDVMLAVRDSLPDGDCKKIFDIQCGIGETYGQFSIEYGDDRAKKNHIARFLGITARSVTIYMENIRTVMLVHGMVPKN